ncbi:MAG: WecB/TagA/CpsF family glycosyltransferase [Bacilli bacterium]
MFHLLIDKVTSRKQIFKKLHKGEKQIVLSANPLVIYHVENDYFLMEQSRKKEVSFILDGIGVYLPLSFAKPTAERYTGISLFFDCLEEAQRLGYRVFLFGSTNRVILKTFWRIRHEYPNIKIVGFHHGFYKPMSALHISKLIASSNPDIVFVALGTPLQERFTLSYLFNIPCKIILPIGGTFDVFSREKTRAPILFQKFGLEWLYRIVLEPKRLKHIFKYFHLFFKLAWRSFCYRMTFVLKNKRR